MYDMKNLAKMKTIEANAPEAMKAFVAFDKAAMAAGASGPPQGGSPALVVKSAIELLIFTAAKVTVCAPTLVTVMAVETGNPIPTVPKLTADGVNLMAVPVPDSATVWGLLESVSVTLSVPVT